MLGGFKKERMQTVKNWQDMQKIMDQRRACRPVAGSKAVV